AHGLCIRQLSLIQQLLRTRHSPHIPHSHFGIRHSHDLRHSPRLLIPRHHALHIPLPLTLFIIFITIIRSAPRTAVHLFHHIVGHRVLLLPLVDAPVLFLQF